MALAKNSLLSVAPPLAGLFVGVITVPLYISIIGSERYGALLLAWVLLGYFGQADFGLGRAITQRISSMLDATAADRATVVWSAIAGALGMAAIGAVLVYLAAQLFFGRYFEAELALRNEAVDAAWLFALCVPVIMFTGVSSGALYGRERFAAASIGTTVSNLLAQTLPLVVAATVSVEFVWLLGASLIGRCMGLAVIMVQTWRVMLAGQAITVARQEFRKLFSFGAWIMVSAVIGPLMTMSDRTVIGATIGALAVVAYSVPFQIAQRTIMFPIAVMQALFPRFAAQSLDQARSLGREAVVLVGQLYAFVVIGLICLAQPLLHLWLGDDLDSRSALVGQIALIGFYLNALANAPYALIQARGNPRFTALVHLTELPVYFALLYVLGTHYGLFGIATAFALRNLIDCTILFTKARFLTAPVLLGLLTPSALIAISFIAAGYAENWHQSLALAAGLGLLLAALSWIQMPPTAKRSLMDRLAAGDKGSNS